MKSEKISLFILLSIFLVTGFVNAQVRQVDSPTTGFIPDPINPLVLKYVDFNEKTKYPDIVAPSTDAAREKAAEMLFLLNCYPAKSFGTTFDTTTDAVVVKDFQKLNGLKETGEIHADTWKALYSTTSKKCPDSIKNKYASSGASNTNGAANTSGNTSSGDPSASEDYYVNVSSFDGTEGTKTTFTNTSTGSMSTVFNYLLTLMAVAIVVLVIFRVLQGAVIKGTFDNIYNQMKGKSMIQNAGKALFVFILVYAVLTFINPDLVNWTLDTSYKADLSKSPYANSGGGSCPVDPYAGKSLREMIIFNEYQEGKDWIYPDTENLMSIGVGFNLERSGSVDTLKKAGVPEQKINQLMTAVKAGKEDKSVTIDKDTMYKLLDIDIAEKKVEAVTYFKNKGMDFNSLPANVQNVIIDMMFNLGVAGFDKFTKMLEGIKAKDWAEASRQIIASNYCSQVKSRCYRNAAFMSPGCGGALNNNTNTSSGGSLAAQNSSDTSGFKKVVPCPANTKDLGTTRTNYIGNPTIRLCKLSSIDGAKAIVNATVAESFQKMGEAYTASTGKRLSVNSAYRPTQTCKPSGGCASQGTSLHQLGIAIDFAGTGGKSDFNLACNGTNRIKGNTDTYSWLLNNSKSFGAKQFVRESWHFDLYSNACRY